MSTNFSHDFFTGNRNRLVQETGAKLIALTANGLLQRSADTTFPFRQDSNFWYLTGLEEPDYTLVIHEGESFLIAPKRAEHRDLWDGAVDKTALAEISGISDIKEYHDGWMHLDKLLKKNKKAHTIAPAEPYFEHFGFYANPARANLLAALQKHRKLELVDIRKILARLRQIKQAPELDALQQAIDMTAGALQQVRKKLSAYKTENHLAADLTQYFIKKGSKGHAYQPIVAQGANAATIHYIDNNQPIESGALILLDVGAEVDNYSADITRTYAPSEPTARQKAVHKAVSRVHKAAFELLKPGLDMKDYEKRVDAIMAGELKKLKLLDDITNKKKLKKYYPHLTSHFLGLDTHDAADYTLPLAENMVLTVEPGIYIPEEGIGIRIEDDVVITKKGARSLSANLPTNLW